MNCTNLLTISLLTLLIIHAESTPHQVVEVEKPVLPSSRTIADTQPAGYENEKLIPPSQMPAETQPLADVYESPRQKRSTDNFKGQIVQAIKMADLEVFGAVERNPTDVTRTKFIKLAERLTEQGAQEVVSDATALNASKSVKEFLGDSITKSSANQLAKALITYLAIEKEEF